MVRMSTLDAGFFFVEHQNVPMHMGSLAVFEGPARPMTTSSGCWPRSCRWCRATARRCVHYRSRSSVRCGWTTSTSRSAITRDMPLCQRRADPSSCAPWPPRSSPGVWTAPGRFGRRGSSKAWTAAAGRSSSTTNCLAAPPRVPRPCAGRRLAGRSREPCRSREGAPVRR
jgi:hypothetical protein